MKIAESVKAARMASEAMALLRLAVRNSALEAIAEALETHRAAIEQANQVDIKRAETEQLALPLLKRLKFQAEKITDAIAGVRSLVKLADPVGCVKERRELADGLVLSRESTPMGVIGIIFESRPDALVQIASLCLKSGNCCLLKGGREARETNRCLFEVIREATRTAGVPMGWIQLIESREDVGEMLSMDDAIDLLIPRGSNAFVQYMMAHTKIPVMGHADGICHVYIDEAADPAMAITIAEDAKCQYPAVCNAMETLLVHSAVPSSFWEGFKVRMQTRGVRLVGCERAVAHLDCELATPEDWDTEYLDLTLSVKVVDSLDEAIAHIRCHGSGHTEAIVTQAEQTAEAFLNRVDAADVFWNCSTRFADGFRFGLGAEVGISTSKLHARGPVGLEGLMSYKWKLRGHGDCVAPFAAGERRFTHRTLPVDSCTQEETTN